jgi:uncharacterized protein (TIGR00255 family)
MLSMTGFGTGTAGDDRLAITVQIASVNHRGCQVQVRSDQRDLASDELVRQEVRTALARGSITVQVQTRSAAGSGLDLPRLAAAWRELAGLARELGAPVPALERVVGLAGGNAVGDGDEAEREAVLRAALRLAIDSALAGRRREGAALAAAFRSHAGDLRRLLPQIRAAAAARQAAHRDLLAARLGEVLADQPAIRPDELVRELALYADRIDITEELVRFAAHLDALDALIAGPDDQLGRKLDFLLQEIGREINTTGAKSNDLALTNLVLEAKSLVEQMKEQAANVC